MKLLVANLGSTSEQISVNLAAGTYYARVLPQSLSIDTKYTLTLKGPPADVGNTFATAKNVSSPFSGGQTIGGGDTYDFYKIDGALFSPAEAIVTSVRSGVTYRGGRRGHMLAFVDAVEGAQDALARAVARRALERARERAEAR